jgi:hypothetical protein
MCIIRFCEQSEAIQPTLKQSGLPRRSAPRKDDSHLTQPALASVSPRLKQRLEHFALNLHHPSLRAKRGNPDSDAAGLPRFARNDDSHLLHCALDHSPNRLNRFAMHPVWKRMVYS